jgi:hypothetical protein
MDGVAARFANLTPASFPMDMSTHEKPNNTSGHPVAIIAVSILVLTLICSAAEFGIYRLALTPLLLYTLAVSRSLSSLLAIRIALRCL